MVIGRQLHQFCELRNKPKFAISPNQRRIRNTIVRLVELKIEVRRSKSPVFPLLTGVNPTCVRMSLSSWILRTILQTKVCNDAQSITHLLRRPSPRGTQNCTQELNIGKFRSARRSDFLSVKSMQSHRYE